MNKNLVNGARIFGGAIFLVVALSMAHFSFAEKNNTSPKNDLTDIIHGTVTALTKDTLTLSVGSGDTLQVVTVLIDNAKIRNQGSFQKSERTNTKKGLVNDVISQKQLRQKNSARKASKQGVVQVGDIISVIGSETDTSTITARRISIEGRNR